MMPISKWVALLLVAPAIMLVAGVVIASLVGRRIRRQCPACLQKSLKQVSVVRAESVVDGESAPDYRSYFRCEKCGERFKLRGGVLSGVPADEMSDAARFG